LDSFYIPISENLADCQSCSELTLKNILKFNEIILLKPYADDFGNFESFSYELTPFYFLSERSRFVFSKSNSTVENKRSYLSDFFGILLISTGAASLFIFTLN